MKKIILAIFIILSNFFCIAQKIDSLQIVTLNNKIQMLDNNVKEIRRDQLNYKIEKDLLKESYSNNYERINLVITIVLGIIGILGYLGLKDINTVKKEYITELSKLNKLKSDLEIKITLVSDTQIKYEKEILEIIRQNEEQNRKIQTLESINKIYNLKKEKKYPAALEECLRGLSNDQKNIELLMQKSLIYSITHSYPEAVSTLLEILQLEPENTSAILNLSEAYMLNNQVEDSEKLISDHQSFFKGESGQQAIKLFSVLKQFNLGNKTTLIKEIKNQIDEANLDERKNRFDSWNLDESIAYINFSPPSNIKNIIKKYFDYSAGKISGNELIETLEV